MEVLKNILSELSILDISAEIKNIEDDVTITFKDKNDKLTFTRIIYLDDKLEDQLKDLSLLYIKLLIDKLYSLIPPVTTTA